MKAKQAIKDAKKYIAERSELFIGIGVVGILVVIIGVIVLVTQLNGPHIVYQPAKACSLLTPAKAEDLLGDKVYSTDANEPQITGNVATSKCSYTDQNASGMKVAAIAVRSGINDQGDAQNKSDFAKGKKAAGMMTVPAISDDTYFNPRNGQLNILKGHMWLIVSYGTSDTQSNLIEDDVILAQKILNK